MSELSAVKRRVDHSVRELFALSLVACNMTAALRERLNSELALIPTLPTKALRALEEHTTGVIEQLREKLGALKTNAEYLGIAEDMEKHRGLFLWLPKHVLDNQFFSKLKDVARGWEDFPPHTRFGIDYYGELAHSLEWRLLEATLFESAALLWNDVVPAAATAERAKVTPDKIPEKRYQELQRSTIRATFALLEGYLNGIAFDVMLTMDMASPSKGARELIHERSDDGKSKFKTLKEKIYSYPRIALGLEHSPLDEANEHVAYIIDNERKLRDAFVHPTPRMDDDGGAKREQVYYEFTQKDVSDLLDHTIGLIRYIDETLAGKFGRVSIWLVDRAADGQFPPKTFD